MIRYLIVQDNALPVTGLVESYAELGRILRAWWKRMETVHCCSPLFLSTEGDPLIVTTVGEHLPEES